VKPHEAQLYHAFAGVYDKVFERFFRPRIRRALQLLNPRAGDRFLDVGVGTGLSLPLYPSGVGVTGIDLAAGMLRQARRRARKHGVPAKLAQMDAQRLAFPADTFDGAVVAFIVSVVPEPKLLMREVSRVVKPGGPVAVLNHFRAAGGVMAAIEDRLAKFCLKLGWRSDQLFEDVFEPGVVEIARVATYSRPDLWKIVICRNLDKSGDV